MSVNEDPAVCEAAEAQASDAPLGRGKKPCWLTLAGVAAVVLVADVITKWWATAMLTPDGFAGHDIGLSSFLFPTQAMAQAMAQPNYPPHEVISGCFNFYLAHNTGGAFSVLSGNPLLLAIISLVILVALIGWARTFSRQHLLSFAATGMVIGGAIGNIVDRLRFGYVIDFIDWYYASSHWPTFNVADSFIDIGLAIIIILAIFTKQLDSDPKSVSGEKKSNKSASE
ncbi:signal peptidase II [Candidatus Sumerlaeota bacterium]|nr:signal peptidase II [Candidatus Sumerlaeales bacterium]NLD61026.1 signal peptidase II [Candidatus Sumerlaeota bacterium]